MSDLTKLLRSNPVTSAVLSGVEAVEGAVKPVVQQGATVAIQDVGALIEASATALLSRYLGPAATLAEPVVTGLIGEFETFLTARL